ncbi:MAG: group 1 glycosyl transferase [Patescibacteria group bacterium]|nr:group 1 glycosyl transferase [Patescibacteria group bacterium]
MKVNVISESAFTVQGHGVHSAFTDTIDALREYSDWDVAPNTDRPADVVHIHTVGPYSLKKLLWGKGVKVVSAHVTPDSFVGSLIGAKYWYGVAKVYLRWFYNRADGVLAVSGEVVDELKAMGVRRPVYLVPNTIRTRDFATTPESRVAAREKLGVTKDAFVVLASGQVQPRKRVDTFVNSARGLPGVRFVWVGGMPFKGLAAESGAMTEVMEHHPENVRFTGMLKREEVMRWYQAADLYFLPSIQETFGIVIVEAAAAGLPVLLRDLEQYGDTFGDGYERGTEETFKAIIEKFWKDRAYYRQWQKAAATIAERYDAKMGAARLTDVYAQVIAAKRQKKA